MNVEEMIVGKRYLIQTNSHHDYSFVETIRAKFKGVDQFGRLRFSRLFSGPEDFQNFHIRSDEVLTVLKQQDAPWDNIPKSYYVKAALLVLSWLMIGGTATILLWIVVSPIWAMSKQSTKTFLLNKKSYVKSWIKNKLKSFLND
jgi:hypothetical protein